MTENCSATRRFLALWFPFLSADRLRSEGLDHRAGPPDAPLIFVEKTKNALRVAAADARAQSLGLTPGLALADARAREPQLVAISMDKAADRHLLDRLARRCIHWSPTVVLAPPDGISIDIMGAAHLFGGEAGLIEEVEAAMTADGMTVRLACAATAEGAQALARYAACPVDDEAVALRALPVAVLNLEPQAILGLQRAGLKTLGAVAGRSSASIAARFGMDAVTSLERILGTARGGITPLVHDAPLRFEQRFAEPVAHQTSIAAALSALLDEAIVALSERGLGGGTFRLKLCRSDGAKHYLDIKTRNPTRDPALVLRLFDERAETLNDPLDPGFGYDSLLLAIPMADPLNAEQHSFAHEAKADIALSELIDRFSTRLGPGQIRRMVPHDSHIPEQAQLALPAIEVRKPAPWPAPPPGEPPVRPLFLFDPPQLVEVIAEVPDGPPHRFRWKKKLHEVRLYEGPERIAAEWWRRRGGECAGKGGLTRDYYRIEDAFGRRYWIFRHGLYEEKPDPKWYLHGLFA
ncbi:MAG: DNA polymerase Y family protein [Sphingopyxis sp.]|nr:DNA polymerase Y family protein [Sphingopyxis sp.]